MGRSRHADLGPPPLDEFDLPFILGQGPDPDDPYTDEQLGLAWRLHGAELMAGAASAPGDRFWGYWDFELGIDEPTTRLERVLELDRCGLLTDEERSRIAADAERAAKRFRGHVVTGPRGVAESMERAAAGARGRGDRDRRGALSAQRTLSPAGNLAGPLDRP